MMIVWVITGCYQNYFLLCTTVVHNGTHVHEQFLKMNVGSGFVFLRLFRFSSLHVFLV